MPDQAPASPNTTDNDALLQLLAQRLGVPRMQAASQAAPATPQSNVVPFRSKQQVEQELNALQPPQAPTLKQIPTQAPAAEYTPIFKAMSPGMMLLATLAGAFTRNPMTSAVQNAGEFLKGVHEGDQELAADKLKKFNADVDAATKSNNEATQQYKLALDQYGNNTAKLQNELVGIALRNNDDPVKALIEAGQYKDAIGLIEARDKMAASIQEHKDTLALRVEGAGKPAALVLSSGETVDGFYNPYTGFTDLSGNAIAKTDVKHFYLGVPAEGIITDSTAQRAAEMAVDKGDYRDAVASAGGFGNVGNINRGKIAKG